MGRAIQASPARSGLHCAVLEKRYRPVGRRGTAQLSDRA
jgi:hypothetical protein